MHKHTARATVRRTAAGIAILPDYLRYPFEVDTGRTLMKVGRSDSGVIQRIRTRSVHAALPENLFSCEYTAPTMLLPLCRERFPPPAGNPHRCRSVASAAGWSGSSPAAGSS